MERPRVEFVAIGQFHNADRAVGAGDDKPRAAELDIGRRRLEHMRRDLPARLDDLFAGA